MKTSKFKSIIMPYSFSLRFEIGCVQGCPRTCHVDKNNSLASGQTVSHMLDPRRHCQGCHIKLRDWTGPVCVLSKHIPTQLQLQCGCGHFTLHKSERWIVYIFPLTENRFFSYIIYSHYGFHLFYFFQLLLSPLPPGSTPSSH